MQSTLGKMREWIQWNAINGSSVIWGSDDIPKFQRNLSVKFFEELALELSQDKEIEILQAERGTKQLCIDDLKRELKIMSEAFEEINNLEADDLMYDMFSVDNIIDPFITGEK
jgi:hypothetical protein